MADTNFLQQARCLHLTPEKVHDERFQEESGFFDPKDIVQVKYELLRSCAVEGSDVASACMRFGFSRTTYYKVYEAFIGSIRKYLTEKDIKNGKSIDTQNQLIWRFKLELDITLRP